MSASHSECVPAGTYSIRSDQKGSLKAYLGTCVGVVLLDRISHVGGLMHLLLPEPPSPDNPWQPESYASTGLPIFIEALAAAGAQIDRLEAFVAGGALTGRLSETDLFLDIGGRTTDVVMDVLRRYGIAVKRSETGGLFNMVIEVAFAVGDCSIEPMVAAPAASDSNAKKPSREEIIQAAARIRAVPQVALKIIRMISDDYHSMIDIAAEVRQDQVISARVLSLANSAMIGWNDTIDSVDEALMVLGEKAILRLVVSASMELFFPESERGYSQCKGRLFHHAIGVGLVAEQLARVTGKSDPGVAYTAGLLHDIGKVVLDHFVAENIPLFYRLTRSGTVGLERAETEILGIGHSEAGSMLTSLWHLPGNLIEAISYHHTPEKAPSEHKLASIVCLADFLVSRFWVNREMEHHGTFEITALLDLLELSPDQIPAIVDSIAWHALSGDLNIRHEDF
ncbi:MAG: HDOD domain-containing protein [Nitrospirae bacterium]|nr:HDOD domain-containing protein [Nitrospirota bacterium]